ncbi:uncharacterized protein KGF55_000683 [Candida pseudojiufengensis]|uniref:uncharacterized protein n=1 Tax=Candida pseudojiufengensis TaxID=497109 RepID=UPI0022253B46|nr:uncharacterized protein KGF55_000683 [Candida pseudojiufengensis]KAI5966374.1 hypothetical protein KGF55_000683 [Candida pseudojiufengensis]
MPPQLTFIKLTNELSIPIKLYIKRFETSKNSKTKNSESSTSSSTIQSLSINEVSPITIHNITTIKLSPNQISEIITKITPIIKPIIYDISKLIQSYKFEIENLKIEIPIDILIQIRYKLRLIDFEEAKKYLNHSNFTTLVKKSKFYSKKEDGNEERQVVFEEEENGVLNPNDDDIEITDAKNVDIPDNETIKEDKKDYRDYTLSGKQIVGDFIHCIKVFVY